MQITRTQATSLTLETDDGMTRQGLGTVQETKARRRGERQNCERLSFTNVDNEGNLVSSLGEAYQ